ncbi:hypothetical protein M9H77_35689 [Catharanthus roseus]|uniref:Uncharacterized protein n=1 Tax=Catharanthus roseus TaxID=4058 RepID=A0ACB9ZPR4_CATRO|nr:hypothetical protein M9H77_35689 [Catharanthus roseus]
MESSCKGRGPDFLQWLRNGCSTNKVAEAPHVPWGTLFSFTCWILWQRRNKSIFELEKTLPPSTEESAQRAREFTTLGPSWFKLNIDESALGNPSLAGARGNLGATTNCVAELWGLKDGLKLAWSLNVQNLEIETNATLVCNLLNQITFYIHPFYSILSDFLWMMTTFVAARISHVYRETNMCTDALAKHGGTVPLFCLTPLPLL